MAQPEVDRWPSRLIQMKSVEDLLRCGICFDYFNIAMIIPQCSHNYCSLCIRKFLSYKTQCPTCCVTVTEPDLKNNRVLDELVKNFSSARNQLLQFTFDSPPVSPPPPPPARSFSGKSQVVKMHAGPSVKRENRMMMESYLVKGRPSIKKLEKPKRGKEGKIESTGRKPRNSSEIKGQSNEAGEGQGSTSVNGPEQPSTSAFSEASKVECPVCSVNIPEAFINKHLDSCLSREKKKESLRSSNVKRKTLPKVVYNLLSERDLRKKLKEYGLSSHGNKQQLIRRHQEFVHMYNAQSDSLYPKPGVEIVKEIEAMEKTRLQLESKRRKQNVMVFTKDQTEKEIDDIHSKYRKEHQNEFKLLVDEVKKRCKKTGKVLTKEIKQEVEESKEELLPVATGGEDGKPVLTDVCSDTVQLPQSEVESQIEMEQDAIDDSSNLPEVQETPLIMTSDSGSSSSSDIIRDLIEEKEFLETRGRNKSKKMTCRKSCRIRTPESSCSNRRSKRLKN